MILTFNASTFSTKLSSDQYEVKCGTFEPEFSGQILNETSVMCFNVSSDSPQILQLNVFLKVISTDWVVISENPINYYLMERDNIHSNILVGYSGNRVFNFTFDGFVHDELKDYLECRFDDGQSFKAHFIEASQSFSCDIYSMDHTNLSFWFNDPNDGIEFQISSNALLVSFYKMGSISYLEDSRRAGYVDAYTTIAISADINLLQVHESRYVCKIDGKTFPIEKLYFDQIICNITSNEAGLRNVSLWYIFGDTPNSELLLSNNSLVYSSIGKNIC